MAKLVSSAPTFLVNDVAMTAHWYSTTWDSRPAFPKTRRCVYGSLQRDGVEIMLLRQEGYRAPDYAAGGVWDAYIRMQGLVEFVMKCGPEFAEK